VDGSFLDHHRMDRRRFVGIVALNIFIGVLLRNNAQLCDPGFFDIGRMLLGILIFGASPPPAIAVAISLST